MSEETIILVCCAFILGFLLHDKIHNVLASRKKKEEGG